MNTQELLNLTRRRCPDHDESEILLELNKAYGQVWADILKTDDSYFEDKKVVTVSTEGTEFDLLRNFNDDLSSRISPLLHTVSRIRVLPPNTTRWQLAHPVEDVHSAFLAQQMSSTPTSQQFGAFLYRLTGKATLQFGLPLPVNTQIEVTYVSSPIPLTVTREGLVGSLSTAVTGTGTAFTKLLPPDIRSALITGQDMEVDVSCELIAAGGTFRVKSIASDTGLVLYTAPSPVLATAKYTLAVVPDLPDIHHTVIVDLAVTNLFLRAEGPDGQGYVKWNSVSRKSEETMINAMSGRQSQQNPRKIPYFKRHRCVTSTVRY